VDDVDAEYARLRHLVKIWIKPPMNQPWGTRSMYFRDPDGNLVDFWAPARGTAVLQPHRCTSTAADRLTTSCALVFDALA